MVRRRSASSIRFLAFLVACAAMAVAAHSKTRSAEPLDAVFHASAPGTVEASLNPPIKGVLRIVVRAGASRSQPRPGGSAGALPPQSEAQPFTFEVTQSDRPIPFRFVRQSGRHILFGGAPALLVVDIDVNDLTPGLPVRVRVHSNLTDPPDLEARAYQVAN